MILAQNHTDSTRRTPRRPWPPQGVRRARLSCYAFAGVATLLILATTGCGQLGSQTAAAPPPTTSALQDYTQAQTLQSQNQCSRAITFELSAISKNSIYVSAYSGLGYCYQVEGAFNSAIAAYNKAIRIDPKNYGLYIARAGAEALNGSSGAATADDLTALRLAPVQAPAYTSIGGSFASFQDFSDAITAYNRAIALVPANPSLYELRANVYLQIQDLARGYADYRRAIKVAPSTPARAAIYTDFATAASQQDDFDTATKAIASAIHLSQGNADFYIQSAAIHRSAGTYSESLKLYDRALKLEGSGLTASNAHEGKGDTLVKMRRTKDAIGEYRLALRLAKGSTDTRSRILGKISAALSPQS